MQHTFDIATLVANNSTSAERTSDKKLALASGKDYVQIAVRTQRKKQFINAIRFTSDNAKGTQLSKKLALATLADYCNGKQLPNTIYSVDATLVKDFTEYLKNNK